MVLDEVSAVASRGALDPSLDDRPCGFCGVPSGRWQGTADAEVVENKVRKTVRVPCCPLCALMTNLQRPRINEEAVLVWLPEMTQQVINAVVRDIHMSLHRLGEPLAADAPPAQNTTELRELYHARAAMAQRAELAEARLATRAPADLASALLNLSPASYARRFFLLGGIRLLPLGRLYQGDRDVYPEIVGTWLDLSKPIGPSDARATPFRIPRK